MKEVWFYLYKQEENVGYYETRYETQPEVFCSEDFNTFEEAVADWEKHKKWRTRTTPFLKGYEEN